MWKILELSRLFVCLGGLAKFFSAWGAEKIAGLWFALGGLVPRLTLWWIFPKSHIIWKMCPDSKQDKRKLRDLRNVLYWCNLTFSQIVIIIKFIKNVVKEGNKRCGTNSKISHDIGISLFQEKNIRCRRFRQAKPYYGIL